MNVPSPETLSLLGMGFVSLFGLSKLLRARIQKPRRASAASP